MKCAKLPYIIVGVVVARNIKVGEIINNNPKVCSALIKL